MAVTLIYTGVLSLWFLVLSLRVIAARSGRSGPSLGDGGDVSVQRRIRGHANFAEYVPLILVLLGLLEWNGLPRWAMHVLGAMLLAGRLLHGYALSFTAEQVFARSVGIVLTLLPLLLGGVLALYFGVLHLNAP